MEVTCEHIINATCTKLYDDSSVYAFWLEGSHAHGIADEYSDIDMWFDVEDGREAAALDSIRDAVSAIAPIDCIQQIHHPHPQIQQVILHLSGTPESMRLDICVQSHSRDICFLEGFADQKIKVLFDKCNVIRYDAPDWQAMEVQQTTRVEELAGAYPIARSNVKKEIARGHFLEALDYYHNGILRSLVEVLRIGCQPTKQDYHLKHISRDMPGQTVEGLTKLYAVTSVEDIETECQIADRMFAEAVRSILGKC